MILKMILDDTRCSNSLKKMLQPELTLARTTFSRKGLNDKLLFHAVYACFYVCVAYVGIGLYDLHILFIYTIYICVCVRMVM